MIGSNCSLSYTAREPVSGAASPAMRTTLKSYATFLAETLSVHLAVTV